VTGIYDIGPFRLDAEAGLLTKAGVPVPLGSRAVAVLATLVKRQGEYVQKAAILDAAWPGIVVEESNLAVQISAIRRALAQAPGGGKWIETLARRGYRFVGPIIEVAAETRSSAPGGKRSNLHQPLTSFIGRERELVEIKRLLPKTRLLTLVGVGGIGKTRLALQVAAEVMDAYRDGVWLAELGSTRDPALVPTAVAQVFGVQEKSGTPLAATLGAHLEASQLLLILDNCEHLAEACAELVEAILGVARECTVLVTSREPLQVAGEQAYPLQTLSLPNSSATAEDIGRSEAVQLFVERARQQLPDFAMTDARALALAELCVHLDGIPLALELAAARVRSLSIEQIDARLDDRFKLLTGGTRKALPHQQTLRATFDWSYELLAEDERAVLRRLGIFPGSFALEAVAAIAFDSPDSEVAVIDLLSRLVVRSLVVAETNAAGPRYRLLETTRAYALEKLIEAGEIDAIRSRHAQHFRNRFEPANDDWWRLSDANWRAIYLPELDNLRAGLDWALGADGDATIGIPFAGASGPVWSTLALFGEGTRRIETALGRVDADTSESDQARLWEWFGILRIYSAPTQALPDMERAVASYRRLGDHAALGHALRRVARERVFMGQFEAAAAAFAEAFPLLERSGPPKALACYFRDLGSLQMFTGDLVNARTHFEKAFALYRQNGAESSALGVLSNLADLNWLLGDLDTAVDRFREAVALMRQSALIGRDTLGHCLTQLAGVYIERGDLDEALVTAREGLPLLREVGYFWIFTDHLALRAALTGKLADAARLLGYADSTFAAKQQPREPNEARARKRVQTLLRDQLAPVELERLLAEGAHMSEDEACRIAVEG
jgi:predicted ATPase/DNA-binding winged helix-turn-helix (wHTH) protein